MKYRYALALLPIAMSGCAGQLGGSLAANGLSALGNGGSITPLSNICTTLISQEAMDVATLKAQLEATAAAPMTVMVPVSTPVTVTPQPSGMPPIVKMPSPIPAPKPVPTVP